MRLSHGSSLTRAPLPYRGRVSWITRSSHQHARTGVSSKGQCLMCMTAHDRIDSTRCSFSVLRSLDRSVSIVCPGIASHSQCPVPPAPVQLAGHSSPKRDAEHRPCEALLATSTGQCCMRSDCLTACMCLCPLSLCLSVSLCVSVCLCVCVSSVAHRPGRIVAAEDAVPCSAQGLFRYV